MESINQANADALTSTLRPNPTLWTDVQLLPLTRPFTVTEQGGPPQQDVQVNYPIDWLLFGKRAAAMASANKGLRVSEAEYANLVRQRVTQVALGFFDLLEAKALLDVARQEVREVEQIESRGRTGGKNEKAKATELRQIQLQLLKSRRTLRDAEAGVVTARAKLRPFLGECCDDQPLEVQGTLEAPRSAPPLSISEAFALALQHRPDIQAVRWKLARAHAEIDVEQSKAFPTVTPTLGYTRQYQRKAIGFPDANSWTVAVEMTLPLCNRNEGGRAKAASIAVQSQYELQATEIELRSEIETVLQELQAARANAEAIGQEQLRLATEVRNQVVGAYEAGEGSFLDVLEAQHEYHETCRSQISSRASYWRAVRKLDAAIGHELPPHEEPSPGPNIPLLP